MTSLTPIASSPRDLWITPEEQLKRLSLSLAKESLYANKEKFEELLVETNLPFSLMNWASRSILRESDLLEQNEPLSLIELSFETLVKPAPLPPILTHWYKARKELSNLPKKLPPLPRNILQIIQGKCPFYENRKKPDGTHYKIEDTHVLQLLSEEDQNLNHFEGVVRSYGEKKYLRGQKPIQYPNHSMGLIGLSLEKKYLSGENPLQFRYFTPQDREKFATTPFEPTHWELITKQVLPDSLNQSWQAQVELIDSLSKKAFVEYQVPSLKNISRILFLHKVATGESLYPAGNWQNGGLPTFTRIQEKSIGSRHLSVGSFNASGLIVISKNDDCNYDTGVGTLRKF